MKKYFNILFITAIILAAFFIRVWGINFGLPNLHPHSDENLYLAEVRSIIDSNIKSSYAEGLLFNSFYYCLLFWLFLYKKLFIHIGIAYDFWWWGRLLSATLSALGVFITYLIGKKLFNKKVGILSALLLGVIFTDVLIAHYIKEDVYIQFFGLLAILFFIRVINDEKIYNYILTILFVILAGLAKLNGLIFGLPFIFWGLSTYPPNQKGIKKFFNKRKIFTFACLLSILAVIFINNPVSYRKSGDAGIYERVPLSQKLNIKKMLSPEPPTQIVSSDKDGIKNYLWWPQYLMTSGFYYPLFFLVLFGLIYFLLEYKQKKHKSLIYILLMTILYYCLLSLQYNRFDRWITIITPLLSIFSSAGLIYFLAKIKTTKYLKYLTLSLIFLILIFSLARIVLFDFLISKPDTRQNAFNWIKDNISKDELLITPDLGVLHNMLYNDKYITKCLEIDDDNLWNFNGDLIIFDDMLYRPIQNYKNTTDEYNKIYRGLETILKKGELVKTFPNNIFKKEIFSPYYLMLGSTVNNYHNPTIYIYRIPDLGRPLNINLFKNEYFQNVAQINSLCFSTEELKNGWQGDIFKSEEFLLPQGDYNLNINALIKDNNISLEKVIINIDIWSEGRGHKLFSSTVSLNDFNKTNLFEEKKILFTLNNSQQIFINFYFTKSVDICIKNVNLVKIR